MAPLSTAQLDKVAEAAASKVFNKMKELLQQYHSKLIDVVAKKVTNNLLERWPDTLLERGQDATGPTFELPPLQSCAKKSKDTSVAEGVTLTELEKQLGEMETETVLDEATVNEPVVAEKSGKEHLGVGEVMETANEGQGKPKEG